MDEPNPPTLPKEIPVLPLRRTVAFPLTLQPLAVNRPVSIETVNRALGADRLILLLLQENDADDPAPDDVRKIGTVAVVRQMAKTTGGINIIIEGIARVRADIVTRVGTSMRAQITPLPEPYERLAEIFERVAVSDIAWARTSRWRPHLATLWPGIADVSRLKVKGTEAQAHLLAGWLRSRLGRQIELEHEAADKLVGVELDGESLAFPPGDPPNPADVLSDELERYSRDRVYEDAVRATRM